jgi:hypothetical protein
LVMKNVTKRVVGDDDDRVLIEVVSHLPRGDEYCIE